MKERHTYRRLWLVAALAGLSITGGIGLGQIRPSGRKAGLIQFDAVTELNMSQDDRNTVVFARYWVCQDYYAVAVAWSEPHGGGWMYTWKGLVILSDKTGFRMAHETYHDWLAVNTTYPKPLGERGPFQQGGGIVMLKTMRFAEAEALARRVYVSDLASLPDASQNADRVIDLKAPEGTGGAKRKLAQLKVRARGNRIESMDLLDAQQKSLGAMKYEYDKGGVSSPAGLVAELPARPQKIAVDANVTSSSSRGVTKTYPIKDIDYVSHKGGRTCTVAYKDMTIGDQVLRLPVHVEVRVSEDKRLLRSTRLINFQHVNLDKTGVWEAAKAFTHLSDEDRAYYRLVRKYITGKQKAPHIPIDPNDMAFVKGLIAKYPVPELAPVQHKKAEPQAQTKQKPYELSPEARMQQARRQIETRKQEQAEWQEQVARMPKPPRKDIEPNDVRMLRQLCTYYERKISSPLTQDEEKLLKENGSFHRGPRQLFGSERQYNDLSTRLHQMLGYHRVPSLPEDNPPRVEPADCELIKQLQAHYEKLSTQQDLGLEGRLRALEALTRMDTVVNDYRAFEGHTIRYLQMVEDANLAPMYMAGGYESLEDLMKVGRYEEANRLIGRWAARSAADNDVAEILRFARYEVCRAGHWWTSVHLLDEFLKKRDLTREQRYEGLALRAVALHKLDKLLGSVQAGDSEPPSPQAQWVLSTTTRAELAKKVEPALRQATQAWEALGEARLSEAKPYSTANQPAANMNLIGFPEATPLQETSWQLDNAIRERAGKTAPGRPKASR